MWSNVLINIIYIFYINLKENCTENINIIFMNNCTIFFQQQHFQLFSLITNENILNKKYLETWILPHNPTQWLCGSFICLTAKRKSNKLLGLTVKYFKLN